MFSRTFKPSATLEFLGLRLGPKQVSHRTPERFRSGRLSQASVYASRYPLSEAAAHLPAASG